MERYILASLERMFGKKKQTTFVYCPKCNNELVKNGDYVNGKKIDVIIDNFITIDGADERILCFETDYPIEKGLRAYHDNDIKTIVTKEQIEFISYKIKGVNDEN